MPSPRQRTFFEQAAAHYHRQLASDTAVQAYLTSRGISPAAASTFRLGAVRDALVGHEAYEGRLAIPFITPAGVVNFVFRCAIPRCERCPLKTEDGGHPKYLADLPERTIYNVLDLATEGQEIHVTEGELDALTLSLAGFPAVGIGGVDGFKPFFKIVLADYQDVYAWGDGDQAGRKFNKKLKTEVGARPVAVPKGEDVNAIWCRAGVEGLRACLQR